MQSEPLPSSGNYMIVCELRSGSLTKFEGALAGFGTRVRLNQTVWLLQTEATLASVRNQLLTCTMTNDMLFIVDVGKGRRAWNNVWLSLEAQLRAIWKAPAAAGS